ncbi:flagellar hook protein FlgE [Marivivens sp. LCG002]|uniref:flagellar hook protein FlgE n=1 Tax=Marivivens sp. LCG002 TaxID=3051171 RepID=UPI0025530D47|nr:flagellar hook protein FlgE [Marivivens sp. LCG002]WIV51263.1 flagellar hook protein FlgE [Marivivens sp. LCG002]
MSMTTALSGLIAAQNDISTTSNNIANVGTNGFRKSRVQFADEFYTTPLGASRKAIGGGTHVQSVSVQFGQGNFMASGNTLDLAIQGSGFFSVGATMTEEGRAVEVAYTRSGAFNLNQDGQILDGLGRPMLTWPVAEDGSALEQSIAAARPVHVPTSRGVVKATENINLQMRLPSDDTMLNRQDAVPPTNAFDPMDPTTYTFTTTIPITDKAGDSMEAQAYFIKTDSPDALDPTSTFELRLYVDGVEQPAFGSPDSLIKFDEFGLVTPADATFNMGTPQGSWNVSFTGSMLEPQTAAVKSAKHDGANSSGLSNLEVDESGTIWANYGIEERLALGRVAIANFANPNGLRQLGNASYAATAESGTPKMAAAGKAGVGVIQSGMLERSNVDLTDELVSLISAQRNYQANAKAMETSSSLMQTILNIRS